MRSKPHSKSLYLPVISIVWREVCEQPALVIRSIGGENAGEFVQYASTKLENDSVLAGMYPWSVASSFFVSVSYLEFKDNFSTFIVTLILYLIFQLSAMW